MKKVSVLFTSVHFPSQLLRFVTGMASEHSWMLNAIFVHDQPSELDYPFPNDLRLADDKVPEAVLQREQSELEDVDAQIFAKACQDKGISFEISKDISFKQLLHFTQNADLLVVDRHMEFYTFSLLDLLQDAKCPVCLVGDTPVAEHVIFAYDGSDASKKAITSFGQLFPGCHSLPVHVVAVNAREQDLESDDYIHKLQQEYENFSVIHLAGNVKQELERYVNKFEHASMLVLGAFGRGFFSRVTHPSIGRDMLSKTNASMFVAHT